LHLRRFILATQRERLRGRERECGLVSCGARRESPPHACEREARARARHPRAPAQAGALSTPLIPLFLSLFLRLTRSTQGQAAARLLDQLVAAEADRAVLRSDCAALRAAAEKGAGLDGGLFFDDDDLAALDADAATPTSSATDDEDDESPASSGAPTPRIGAGKGAAAAAGPLGSVGAELASAGASAGRVGLGGLGSPAHHALAF
jgi:hypothetical protein